MSTPARTLLLLLLLRLTTVSTRASVLTRLLRVVRLLSREGRCRVTSTRRGRVRRSGGAGRFAVAWRGRGSGGLSGGEFGGETAFTCSFCVSMAHCACERSWVLVGRGAQVGHGSRDRAASAATSRVCGTVAHLPHDPWFLGMSTLNVLMRVKRRERRVEVVTAGSDEATRRCSTASLGRESTIRHRRLYTFPNRSNGLFGGYSASIVTAE